jgi:hypothetical protein
MRADGAAMPVDADNGRCCFIVPLRQPPDAAMQQAGFSNAAPRYAPPPAVAAIRTRGTDVTNKNYQSESRMSQEDRDP